MKQIKLSEKEAAYLERTTPAERVKHAAEFRRLSRSLKKRIHRDIDPDDAARAYITRLTQRLQESSYRTSRSILEDEFLVRLASKPIKEWTDTDWSNVRECAETSDGKFFGRLVQVKKTGKEPLFDEVDIFLLMNWRRGLCLRGKWPRKAVELIRQANIVSKATVTEGWYEVRRKRLGLPSRRNIQVGK